MQRRVLAAAIALMCVIPAVAHAQLMPLQDDPTWGPRLRVTPYVGYLPAVTRHENWIHNSSGQNTFVQVDYQLAGASAIGLLAENTIHGPWNALVGVMYASRGQSTFDVLSTGEEFNINGSRFFFAKAGVSLTLKEKQSELTLRRLSASLFAAPFVMHERPRAELGFEDSGVFDPSWHYGLNLGVSGELPFAQDRFSLQVALEDYATHWSSGALVNLPDFFFDDSTPGASTQVESKLSHSFLMRAGLSYRWR
jgi:hypothetical protein